MRNFKLNKTIAFTILIITSLSTSVFAVTTDYRDIGPYRVQLTLNRGWFGNTDVGKADTGSLAKDKENYVGLGYMNSIGGKTSYWYLKDIDPTWATVTYSRNDVAAFYGIHQGYSDITGRKEMEAYTWVQ